MPLLPRALTHTNPSSQLARSAVVYSRLSAPLTNTARDKCGQAGEEGEEEAREKVDCSETAIVLFALFFGSACLRGAQLAVTVILSP